MSVPSFAFLGYVALVGALLAVVRGARARTVVTVLANLGFIATMLATPATVVPFAIFVAAGFIAMRAGLRVRSRWFLPVVLSAAVLALFWLKRYPIFPGALTLRGDAFTVGASYVFFRIAHLIIDAGQESLEAPPSLLEYLAYTLDFTALVSGPIQLWQDYRKRTAPQPFPRGDEAWTALGRIVLGLFKVGVVSPILLDAHQRAIEALGASAGQPRGIIAAAAVAGIYPLALYANFSGYTDFVIGCARFVGHGLPENFNHPFVATGFIEFWSRWHMSLSSWLRRYVYTPSMLAAMRANPSPQLEPWYGVGAYLLTFSLVGVWHGPTSSFLFFGLLQGTGVAANKAFQNVMISRLGRRRWNDVAGNERVAALSRGLTYTWFAFTLLWFWSSWSSLGQLGGGLGWAQILAALAALFAVAVVTIAAVRALTRAGAELAAFASNYVDLRLVRASYFAALGLAVVSVAVMLDAPAPQIIYRAF